MSRRRRIMLGGSAAVVAVVAALYVAAWLRGGPIDSVGFFAAREGANRPLVFAHQGGEGLAPSNTLVAFRQAAALGADVLDADMHLTADGELVLIHDATVDRTSDGTGAVADLTLAELRSLDFGHHFSPDDGSTHPYRGEGVGIVTVEELFTEFGELRFGIEIKQTTADAATGLCELIGRFGIENRVLVSSFGQANMDVFRAACPEVATSATEDEVRVYYLLHRVGLQGLVDPGYESFQVPEYSGDFRILTPGFVEDARAANLAVVPWTINEEDDLARIVELDVDGVNTDYPDRLLDLVAG